MTFEKIKSFFKNHITYKKGWDFVINQKNGVAYLQIQFDAPDNFTGKIERQFCRKWQLSEWMTKTELVRTAFLAVRQAEQHEMEETFRFKGKDIFNSHLDVEALVEACEANRYQHRPPPPSK